MAASAPNGSMAQVAEPRVGTRLAVVVSHPIQYFSPWFSCLASQPGLSLKVFYLWDFGVTSKHDRDFGVSLKWDIPLLDGYDYEFIGNVSRDPGTHHFRGLANPGLVSSLRAWRPDTILLFGYAYWSHLSLLLSPALRHVPVILRGDSHNLNRPTGFRQALLRRLRRVLLARVNAFLAVGKANEEYFLELARIPNSVFRAPHFVDNARFREAESTARRAAVAWRRDLGIADDTFVIGFVGKLEDKKRPQDLLRAFAGLSPGRAEPGPPSVALLFVGAGLLERSLRDESDRLGLSQVHFAPFQNQTQMPKVYAALDLLVLPSSSETWGLCVNEAMNLGVPAVVSDCVGCGPDLIIPGVTGWTFRCGDIMDLQRALGAAINSGSGERSAMSAAVRKHVAQYSVEHATAGLMKAVRAVTAGSHPRHRAD
jgi:glycosyltransferase involved in cell wall biosynthesis